MPDDLVGAFIVTTDDEKMFHCSVESLGANDEPRWMLRDSNGIQYLGPPVSLDLTPDAVRGLVNEWWALTKAASIPAERTE